MRLHREQCEKEQGNSINNLPHLDLPLYLPQAPRPFSDFRFNPVAHASDSGPPTSAHVQNRVNAHFTREHQEKR